MDIYTIIFLVLAVYIFARLRGVLGQRTGRERPPYNPYLPPDAATPLANPDNGIPLTDQTGKKTPVRKEEVPKAKKWAGIAEAGTPLAASLDAIAKAQPDFDAANFLSGAKAAYEMIVTAFAEGDRETLKNLLAKDVFDGFTNAIVERENRGDTMESRLVSIEKTDVATAELKATSAQITVRFVSKLASVTRNRAGEVIEGSPNGLTDVTDIWTFERDTGERDPNWKLIATESALR